ncbi:MAG: hypothetical protein PHH91_12080 [Desulfuromonadaceae bacterium]|nr:hypothetical protein [Desulfuromonadaceae bacterium]
MQGDFLRKDKTAAESGDDSRTDKEDSDTEKDSPTKEIGNRIRGIFGF